MIAEPSEKKIGRQISDVESQAWELSEEVLTHETHPLNIWDEIDDNCIEIYDEFLPRSQELKNQILELLEKGKTVVEIREHYGVPSQRKYPLRVPLSWQTKDQ